MKSWSIVILCSLAILGCKTTTEESQVMDIDATPGETSSTGLVRIETQAECREFDPFIVDGCKYVGTLNRDDYPGVRVVFFINDDAARYLGPGDLVPLRLEKINKPEYPTEYFAIPVVSHSLVRVSSAPECAEFDPFIVDGCKYSAEVLLGKGRGQSIVFFINDESASYLKAGDLVDVKLDKIDRPEYPMEYFGVPTAAKSLVRVTSSPVCAEFDPFIVDGCRYVANVLAGEERGREITFFINSDSAHYLKVGDLVNVVLRKIGKREYPTEYFAEH